MIIFLVILGAVVVMGGIYAIVIRGGLGLVSKRLEDEPDLKKAVPDDKLDDGLPTDIEY